MLVHLEGNIASGKSTLGQSLAAHPRFHFIPEPVEVWQTGFADNVLDRFYSDMGRWSFTFQVCTFATRVAALRDRPVGRITIAERSIGCDRHVFALSLYEQGALDAVEWEVYRRLWEEMAPKAPRPDAILYLRTPAEECLRRLQARHRSEEGGVSLDYLLALEARHDAWLLGLPGVIVLDGTRRWTPEDVLDRLEERQ